MRFVDTSFWVALLASDDRHHVAARELWGESHTALLTTNHVAAETWTFLRRRIGHRAARRFLDELERSERVTVRQVEEAIESDAL